MLLKTMAEEDNIKIKYKGGGSLIKKAPIFSPDGLCLYIPFNNILRSYSVTTGDQITSYEGCENTIIGVCVHPSDPDLLLACSINGEIAVWKLKAEVLLFKKHILEALDEVYTFNLVSVQQKKRKDSCDILLSYLDKGKYYFGTFEMESLKIKNSFFNADRKPLCVDVGGLPGSQFVAIVDKHGIFCKHLSKLRNVVKLKVKRQTFTCAACHPTLESVAVGDNSGQIHVWYNLFGKPHKTHTIYHWHTLPVNVIAFSCSGSEMYTGANECVVVRWQLDNIHQKQFLPRLPAPIVHLVTAPGNLHLAVATLNNALHVVDARLAVRRLVQEMTWGAPFPAGLHLDPRTKSVVLNGHVGNVQFYSPRTMSLLYNLDIVGQNKLTDERNMQIPNTNVSKLALSKTGEWLACIEDRLCDQKCAEIRLKFFHFNDKDQSFVLNTSVEFPHENGVNSLEFQLLMNQSELLCVTSGGDKLFKVWNLVDVENMEHKSKSWVCYGAASYKGLNAGPVSFSSDGSLVAVAFEACLTVWRPDTCEFKCSLVCPSYKSPLHIIQFGNVDCCHLVVACSKSRLNVWNLLTLGIMRTVEVGVSLLCADPLSTRMAVFTKENSLYVFTPDSASFEYQRNKLCPTGDTALAACFIPHDSDTKSSIFWQRMSQLYFITSSQELLCLESRNETSEKDGLEYNTSHMQKSGFEALLAETVTNTTKRSSVTDNHKNMSGISGGIQIKELIQPPVHTMAPMRFLCGSVLRSLIITENESKHQSSTGFPNDQDDITDENKLEHKSYSELDNNRNDMHKRSNKIPNVKISKKSSKPKCENLKAVLNEPLSWTSVLTE